MTRFACGVEYDGSGYRGWQRLAHAITVQAAVENALGRVVDHALGVVCAGRTDARVHASGQVIHFETLAPRSERALLMGGNSNLPEDIALTWVTPVAPDFHARFSALARSYRYVILNRSTRSALLARRVAWVRAPLDAARMHAAAQSLLGEHDFSSYRAAGCQAKHPFREVRRIAVWRSGDLIYLDIEANAFLHHMVRNIAGVLIEVGMGKRPESWTAELLALRNRDLAAPTARPQGLSLVAVSYPEHFGLPAPQPALRYG
ncbi:MAG: tRNA pseudouridine(38-40) synthase TruA [Thiotrichales bacterium]